MIVGTEVRSDDCPGATGIVTRRVDNDDEVVLLVNWTTTTGRTALTWHRESTLISSSQLDTNSSGRSPDD